MTLVLHCGESLDVDAPRFDETGRFKLILQSDGNLVIYAHVMRPTPRIIPTGATNTGFGADVQLHLSEQGQLQMRRKSDPSKIIWTRPMLFKRPHDSPFPSHWYPFGRPPRAGATLHLQTDGNLVLYAPEMKPETVLWTMGTLLQDLDPEGNPEACKAVAHNAMVLVIGNGILTTAGSGVVRNDTGKLLEVITGMQRPVQIPQGNYATFAQSGVAQPTGTLMLPAFADASGGGDAVYAKDIPLPVGSVISVGPIASGGFGLHTV